ncbi:uncharacterized protein N7483_008016 [Penicillium malachiteum]|uniref:uncharacterized protein n=1 Tax=Penicillium malachiteum TaxID=1324776 RepID=UPI0025488F3A|nr:uncharacterized protein N7483_008016 [Penicillium malachiteum]KAJ5726659.1 hypothetical protein N7483_008016 [Penicillium malachiteum]
MVLIGRECLPAHERAYQLEMLRASLQRNIIVVRNQTQLLTRGLQMDTGTGKTLGGSSDKGGTEYDPR